MTAVLYLTETFQPKLVSSYYNSQNWEANGQFYKHFGVNYYRKLLVLTGWEKMNKSKSPVKKNTLTNLEYKTRQSEFGHLVIFIIVLLVNIFVVFKFRFIDSVWLLVLNILLNFYPILVQRFNRPRIRKLIDLKRA